MAFDAPVAAGFSQGGFTSFDGARLGLSVWEPSGVAVADTRGVGPEIVIVGVHGMNDYAAQFNEAGEWWSAQGATVYAYDQRGFGRSPRSGVWPEHEVMRQDLRAAVQAARARHADARIVVVGVSMGGAAAITAFASDDPPDADALVLSGPGLRGWGALPWAYSASLWASAHVRPGWIVRPPKGVRITATDNNDKLRSMWKDPLVQKTNRIDSVYGVVSLMEEADSVIHRLPESLPTLLLYGARDEVIPATGVKRASRRLPGHVRSAYYADGYHMLLNDLQAETVWRDILEFARLPTVPLPSRAPGLPWLRDRPETGSQVAEN
jgi:alpha-beta hydrolase superfamily lysophospholipase